ncbi:MAG: hypothetical protein HY320_03495, partial [Armatimonadetes bacterium]|nr:hypothetical protein [Armatimonadota bacterium]
FHFLLFEDGLVEWAQFFVYAAACVAAVGVTLRLNRLGLRRQALLYAAFAFGMFFIAGEETAWGQRILGLTTTPALSAINKQDEFTLHNIAPVQATFNFLMLIVSGYGSAAYLANRRLEPKAPYGRVGRRLEQADYLLVPPFFVSSTFMVTFVYKVIRFTLIPESGYTVTRYGEWPELCLALGFFSLAYLNHRRLAAQARRTAQGLEVSAVALAAVKEI